MPIARAFGLGVKLDHTRIKVKYDDGDVVEGTVLLDAPDRVKMVIGDDDYLWVLKPFKWEYAG